jgi:hypothetical protein
MCSGVVVHVAKGAQLELSGGADVDRAKLRNVRIGGSRVSAVYGTDYAGFVPAWREAQA